MERTKNNFYDVYIYRFSSNTSGKIIEEIAKKYSEYGQVYLRDICDEEDELEKTRYINSIITSERTRQYIPKEMNETYLHIIQKSKGKYIAILSILGGNNAEESAQILKTVFGLDEVSYMDTDMSVKECHEYWKKRMSKVVLCGKKTVNEKYTPNSELYLPINIEEKEELFKEIGMASPIRLKSLMSCAFAKVICNVFECGNIAFTDVRHSGKLNLLPIMYKDINNISAVNDMQKSIEDSYLYHNYSYGEVAKLTGIDLNNVIMYTQFFYSDRSYDRYLAKVKAGIIYRLDAIELTNSPLYIMFCLKGDKYYVSYRYDKDFFRGKDINEIHNSFCKVLSYYIEGDFRDADYSKCTVSKAGTEEKILQAKINSLKNIGWFKEYSDEEIKKLAKKCRLARGLCQQSIIEAGNHLSSIFFVLSGKVEVDGRDRKNYINTLLFLKQKDVFGLEGLSEEGLAKVDYRAFSDDAILLMISCEDFWKEADKHPELVKKVISVQSERLYKFQRLWMTQ